MKSACVSDSGLIQSFTSLALQPDFKQRVDEAFSHFQQNNSSYFSFSIPIKLIDALAALEQVRDTNEFHYYWEKPVDQFAFAAGGSVARIQTTGSNRFRQASRKGKMLLNQVFHYSELNHSKAHVHLLGGFSFFDHSVHKNWRNFGAGSFTLPEWQIVQDGKFSFITVTIQLEQEMDFERLCRSIIQKLEVLQPICNVDEYKEIKQCNSSFNRVNTDEESKSVWISNIEKAKDFIETGAFEKIVLARKLIVETEGTISDTCLLNKLRQQYPDCYSFLIRHKNSPSFIGSTPERLASFKNNLLLTEGLAGSISRGKTASEDAFNEHELLRSNKDIQEHAFVVDAIEESLSPYAKRIDHPENPGIKKLSNVQHLYTPITAHLKDDVSRTAVLENLHPTPAVGGYPKKDAVPHISELEDFDRGWYAAPIGWINAAGEGEFAVAIRSGLIKEKEAHFFAGCGIVDASDPQKEWEETNLKFIPMLSALKFATE